MPSEPVPPDEIPLPLVVVDGQVVVARSWAAAQLLGPLDAGLIGRDLVDVVVPEDRDALRQALDTGERAPEATPADGLVAHLDWPHVAQRLLLIDA